MQIITDIADTPQLPVHFETDTEASAALFHLAALFILFFKFN